MCVRAACYIPENTVSPAREHAAWLTRRCNLGTLLVEIAAIAIFLRMVWIWAALGAGA